MHNVSHKNNEKQELIDFLETTEAVATPMEAYALWVSLYEKQGGKLNFSDSNYYNTVRVLKGNLGNLHSDRFEFSAETLRSISYENPWNHWTPKNSKSIIPAGYGSMSRNYLLLPGMTRLAARHATTDTRPGWEWGHSQVFVLDYDKNNILTATTNAKIVTTYADVEKYRKNKSISEMISILSRGKSTEITNI